MATDIERAGLTEGLKKTVEEDLRLSFFVASNVLLTPHGEFGEFFPVRHGGVLQEACRVSNPKLREPAQTGEDDGPWAALMATAAGARRRVAVK
jgi:MYXO-CTERM domain-containing protein